MKGDVLDFTLLKKKGLLKINDNRAPEVIDFRESGNIISSTGTNGSSINSMDGMSPFDMLSSLASASSSNSSTASSSFSSPSESAGDLKLNRDFSSLMSRVENLEYQLERLLEKFSLTEGKIDELMRNVRQP